MPKFTIHTIPEGTQSQEATPAPSATSTPVLQPTVANQSVEPIEQVSPFVSAASTGYFSPKGQFLVMDNKGNVQDILRNTKGPTCYIL